MEIVFDLDSLFAIDLTCGLGKGNLRDLCVSRVGLAKRGVSTNWRHQRSHELPHGDDYHSDRCANGTRKNPGCCLSRAAPELARSYLTITRDLTRVMNRLMAIYRGWEIACAGQQVYAPRYRAEWLAKITEAGVRRRAEIYYQQFDALAALRQGSAPRAIGGIPETSGHEIAGADSLDRPDPRRFVDRSDADTPSLPYPAAAVGLLRTGTEAPFPPPEVEPDVKVPAAEALARAQKLAAEKLVSK